MTRVLHCHSPVLAEKFAPGRCDPTKTALPCCPLSMPMACRYFRSLLNVLAPLPELHSALVLPPASCFSTNFSALPCVVRLALRIETAGTRPSNSSTVPACFLGARSLHLHAPPTNYR